MSPTYKLIISGTPHFQRGVYKATASQANIELVFFRDDEKIKAVKLSVDQISFNRSLENTKNKITLLCNRLGINEKELVYDRSNLTRLEKLRYQLQFLKKQLFEAFIPVQWVIVFKKEGEKSWRKIIPHFSVFQADSFIVYKDEKYYLFYEELKFENYHGYLKVAELDIINNQLINDRTILSLDYHLSYPNVFEENGTFYMIPESGDSHTVDLFECTSFPYEWKKKLTLIDGIQAVDSTPLKTKDGWYLFTTEIVKGAGCNDELSIYKSADLFNKPFIKLYDEPVISDVTNARMAGHFIQRDGEIFRVSQNCGKRYGHQVNINKVIQIENGYKEELIETIKPEDGALGLHTYNQAHQVIVADMEIMRFDLNSLKRVLGGKLKKLLPF